MFSQYEMHKQLSTTDDKENLTTGIKKSKQVTVSNKMVDNKTFTPFQYAKKQPNYSRMKKDLLKALSEERYDEIELYLKKKYTPTEVEDFFKKEGESVFYWTIIASRKSKPLLFLIRLAPEMSTLILKDNNFHILNNLFGAQEMMEKDGLLTQGRKTLSVEKINILFQLNDNEINDFIEVNMPDGVREELTKEQGFKSNLFY